MTPNNIVFYANTPAENTWIMRITADRRIEVNEDVDVTYAAQKVLDAMQQMLAKREWVGLTQDEAAECWAASGNMAGFGGISFEAIRAVEAKLKEKNT